MLEECDGLLLMQKLWSVKVQEASDPIASFFYDEDYDDDDLFTAYNEAVEGLQHAKDAYEACIRENQNRERARGPRVLLVQGFMEIMRG